jgi:hypothetical protein
MGAGDAAASAGEQRRLNCSVIDVSDAARPLRVEDRLASDRAYLIDFDIGLPRATAVGAPEVFPSGTSAAGGCRSLARPVLRAAGADCRRSPAHTAAGASVPAAGGRQPALSFELPHAWGARRIPGAHPDRP